MFEATTTLVLENPVTVIALLPALYFTATALGRIRTLLVSVVTICGAIGLLPVFLLFVIGELTGGSVWLSLGTHLFRFEASIVAGIVRLYDGLLAAWLRVCTLILDSLLSITVLPIEGGGSHATPLDTILPVWITVFVLHIVGGALLVYGLYRGKNTSVMDSLLRGVGITFLVSGLFVVVLQGQFSVDASIIGVLLMAVLGLEIGVVGVLVGVQPDFSAADSTDDFEDIKSILGDVRYVIRSRVRRYGPQNRSEVRDD